MCSGLLNLWSWFWFFFFLTLLTSRNESIVVWIFFPILNPSWITCGREGCRTEGKGDAMATTRRWGKVTPLCIMSYLTVLSLEIPPTCVATSFIIISKMVVAAYLAQPPALALGLFPLQPVSRGCPEQIPPVFTSCLTLFLFWNLID